MAETKNRTVGLELTTSNADIYTVPANYEAEIDNIYINNASTSSVTFSLDWYDAQNTTFYTLAETIELLPNSLLQINDDPLWLFKGDKLRGLASANSAVTITVKVKETYLPQRS
jgi:hypothetical protein